MIGAPTRQPFGPPCDCHFHVFPRDAGTADARYRPGYAATLSDWAGLASAAGILRGVVVQPSFLGTQNQFMLDALARNPTTLRGVAVVAPTARAVEFAALHAGGVRGIRLNLHGIGDDVATVRSLPASWWDDVMAQDMHIELHASVGRAAALLDELPRGVRVVLDHFGKPTSAAASDELLRGAARRPEALYVTFSGAYRQHADVQPALPTLAKRWLDVVGPKRILWASDWPHTNHEREASFDGARAMLDDWVGDASTRLTILHDNPGRLYWRESGV